MIRRLPTLDPRWMALALPLLGGQVAAPRALGAPPLAP